MQEKITCTRPVTGYREGNIVSAFGTDLLLTGGIFVPNLLLRFYKKIGISDTGIMLILQLFRLRTEESRLHATVSELSEFMTMEQELLERELEMLLEGKFLAVTEYYDGRQVVEGFDFRPLFEKISDFWACAKMAEIEEVQQVLKNGARETAPTDEAFGGLYQAFEKEFGRPLSPIEAEQVLKWRQGMSPALVREALRRAVLLGKHNFKYIGTILFEWQKNNLRTLAEVEEYDRNFEARRKRKGTPTSKKSQEDIERKERKKELIRRLYS
ncbi:MAG: DnaD domain protein [Ammonifex sp.]|jgi:DNA replication protein|nr:MAG: DnaD domain protein [Ammonifex sp.]